jgi:threonine aldolase
MTHPEANIAFVEIADAVADRLEAAGLLFYRIAPGVIRFVTSFQTTLADADEVLARVDATTAYPA